MPIERAFGARLRALRRGQKLTQAELARRLGISASYLNLIEHNRRNVTADLLVKLASILPVDLKALSPADDARALAELLEVLGDPLFDNLDLVASEIRELASTHPSAVQAMLRLYDAYRQAHDAAQNLAARLSGDDAAGNVSAVRFPTDEVSDLIQRHLNYFSELERGAEDLARDAQLNDPDSTFANLAAYLQRTHGVTVRIEQTSAMMSALRRYDPASRVLSLSEVLRRGSRNFQLAHQACLLTQQAVLDRMADDPLLTTDEARSLCRVALANYFASAVLMPYDPFLEAARAERYDIELLGDRFRSSFEQVCHRLTTLRRPGAEGVPFHMVRIDIAGNISKRFSASGMPFARFTGVCPRWNVFEAFLTPGMIHTQLSQMPDGRAFFEIASTVRKHGGGYKAPRTQYAVGIGCAVEYAKDIVYADGLDLSSRDGFVPVGPSCRLCDRLDCEQRAFPPLLHPLQVNEQVRGVSFYAPLEK
ncbi:MAG: ImmA/IrrE family metallo-endopeptidase [Acidimicrobiia bacterium]|nr:ImmA/IrrE family metallo-endopeptidase [Acidimicrobiia bacterium]